MNIQLLSDLHLEAHPHFAPEPAPGAHVLVLAGDVGSYQEGSQLGDDDFGLARFSPLPQYAAWPTPVLFVPGNHEYDAQDFDAAHLRLQHTCDRLGIQWLERETLTLEGVRFVGTTLWSDFDALADHAGIADLGPRLKMREKAYRAANFYLRKTDGTRHGEPFLAEPMREQALRCQEWLRAALQVPCGGPTVVVTHFAPACAAQTRVMDWCQAPQGFATRWTICCPVLICGCTAIFTRPATIGCKVHAVMARRGNAASWPTRWGMRARVSRRHSGHGAASPYDRCAAPAAPQRAE